MRFQTIKEFLIKDGIAMAYGPGNNPFYSSILPSRGGVPQSVLAAQQAAMQAGNDEATRQSGNDVANLVGVAQGRTGARQMPLQGLQNGGTIPLETLQEYQKYLQGGGEIPGMGSGASLAGPLGNAIGTAQQNGQSGMGMKNIMTPDMTNAMGGLLGKFLENDPAAKTEFGNWSTGEGRDTITKAMGGGAGFDKWSQGGANPTDLLSALAAYYGG
jgi:hypothetical protein